jgi:hypothetical protein
MYRPFPDLAAGSACPDLPRGCIARNHLHFGFRFQRIDATNDRVIDDGAIIIAPNAWVPALNAGLGARLAEGEGHPSAQNN